MKICFYLLTLIQTGVFVITTWKLLNENPLKNLIKQEIMIHFELLKLKESWHHQSVDLIKN